MQVNVRSKWCRSRTKNLSLACLPNTMIVSTLLQSNQNTHLYSPLSLSPEFEKEVSRFESTVQRAWSVSSISFNIRQCCIVHWQVSCLANESQKFTQNVTIQYLYTKIMTIELIKVVLDSFAMLNDSIFLSIGIIS